MLLLLQVFFLLLLALLFLASMLFPCPCSWGCCFANVSVVGLTVTGLLDAAVIHAIAGASFVAGVSSVAGPTVTGIHALSLFMLLLVLLLMFLLLALLLLAYMIMPWSMMLLASMLLQVLLLLQVFLLLLALLLLASMLFPCQCSCWAVASVSAVVGNTVAVIIILQHDVLAVAFLISPMPEKSFGPWRETFTFPHAEKSFYSESETFYILACREFWSLEQGPVPLQGPDIPGMEECKMSHSRDRKRFPSLGNVKSLLPGTGRLFRHEELWKTLCVAGKMFLYW
jgi:hypothetical protein